MWRHLNVHIFEILYVDACRLQANLVNAQRNRMERLDVDTLLLLMVGFPGCRAVCSMSSLRDVKRSSSKLSNNEAFPARLSTCPRQPVSPCCMLTVPGKRATTDRAFIACALCRLNKHSSGLIMEYVGGDKQNSGSPEWR